MKKTIIAIIIISSSMFLGCQNDDEIEKSRQCNLTNSIPNLVFFLTGFKNIQTVKTIVINKNNKIDSFFTCVNDCAFDSLRNMYTCSINRTLLLDNSYLFIVDSNRFLLSDMRMAHLERHTMFSKTYDCTIDTFCVNGEKIEDSANPDFEKK